MDQLDLHLEPTNALPAEPTPLAAATVPVAILLSTYNGAPFLPEQLQSLHDQTHPNWTLLWRDDGSSDGTCEIMRRFAGGPGAGRYVELADGTHRGITGSFLSLLRQAPPGHVIAFADQDDIWLAEKLARGVAALGDPASAQPVLYCARQMLVGRRLRRLRRIGVSPRVGRLPPFPASLTQNIATGCTVMLNPAAARLVAGSRPPPGTLHDWWSYLLVGAAGGRLVVDPTPVVLYRQHGQNAVGAPHSFLLRGLMALRRGPEAFMTLFRQHVAALAGQPALLSPQAREAVALLERALAGGRTARLAALRRLPHLVRQTRLETLLFRLWFLIG